MIIKEVLAIFNKTVLILCLLIAFSCHKEERKLTAYSEVSDIAIHGTEVNKNELKLNPNKGLIYFENQPFSGTSVVYYSEKIRAETIEYSYGKRHGIYKKWFANGSLSFESHYVNGLLEGTTRSWWKNGNMRSEANYLKGIVNGVQKQWYKSGVQFKEMNILNGKEEGLQKAWRENGKIYNNYEAKNGRFFGLKRATLCYQLEDEDVKN